MFECVCLFVMRVRVRSFDYGVNLFIERGEECGHSILVDVVRRASRIIPDYELTFRTGCQYVSSHLFEQNLCSRFGWKIGINPDGVVV